MPAKAAAKAKVRVECLEDGKTSDHYPVDCIEIIQNEHNKGRYRVAIAQAPDCAELAARVAGLMLGDSERSEQIVLAARKEAEHQVIAEALERLSTMPISTEEAERIELAELRKLAEANGWKRDGADPAAQARALAAKLTPTPQQQSEAPPTPRPQAEPDAEGPHPSTKNPPEAA